jgi:release factor glutamine methyltransferase
MNPWLIEFRKALQALYDEREAQSITRMVLEHVTGKTLPAIMMDPDTVLSAGQETQTLEILKRLILHEPIQYILGETEFYGLRLKVGPGVLIPRGETEELVDWILRAEGRGQKANGRHSDLRSKKEEGLRILDIGCGSGAIAVVLAKHMPDAAVFAVDVSETALDFTQINSNLNKVHITTVLLDILNPDSYNLQSAFCLLPFDLIVSNPPYVAEWDRTHMAKNVLDYEPHMALFAPGDDPLVFYRAISGFAAANLATGGEVFVEINESIGEETAEIFRRCFKNVELRKDINGKDRMIRASNG